MQITITVHKADKWGRLGQALTCWTGYQARRAATTWLAGHPGYVAIVRAL